MLTLSLILFPALVGLLLLTLKTDATRNIAFVAAVVEMALAGWAFSTLNPDGGSQFGFDYAWLLNAADGSGGVRFSGGIDGISILLVALTGILVPLIILSTFARRYSRPLNGTFYGLVLLMQAALMGVFTARDAFLFYFFFEATLIPIYFLAAGWGGENRVAVTFKFFIYTIFGSLFMLLAFVYLFFQTNTTGGAHSSAITDFYNLSLSPAAQGWLFWALFIAFAVKMPVFPFHTWQPDTYVESPTPATMLLAGIMLKMGVYGLIRFILPTVPLGVESWGLAATVLSVIGIVYGAVIAIQQRDMKRLIAYSSLSHVGLMAAGVFSLSEQGLQGALIQMLTHGLNVVGLFFVADVIATRTQTRLIDSLGGITKTSPRLTVYFMIILLGSVALPLTNGFVGEFLLLQGIYDKNAWLGAVAGLTIIFGAVYLLRAYQKTMFGQATDRTRNFWDVSPTESWVFIPIVILIFWIGLYPNAFLKLTQPAVTELLNRAVQGGLSLK